ncbi:putative reverse transcriptase domain-containing protein [Tanacetum coccineum]
MTHPYPKGNFVPKVVLMKSGFKTLNSARQNFSRAAVLVNTTRLINIAYPRPIVNSAWPASNVSNSYIHMIEGPLTIERKAIVSDNKGNEANDVKALAYWVWKPKHKILDHVFRNNGVSMSFKRLDYGNPQKDMKDKGVINSRCFRHMTWNRSYLIDYEDIDGGFIAFGGSTKGGKINGKVPREDNMYSVDLKNVVPQGGLTYLFEKATSDESNLWHRRLGYVNFKNINKLVKGNLIRGIENLIDLKVKVIRCDNGTEFKSRVMNQFCEIKGIKREFSVARTPQQNREAERKNKTLIKAARTMLADSKLPTTFWSEAVNTACYADEGFFVGYSTNSKAFRVFNSRTRIVEENLHIKFSEDTPIIAGSKASMETVPGKDYILLPLWTQYLLFSSSQKDSPDAGFKPLGEEEKKDAEDLGNEDSEVPSTEKPRVNQEKDANVNITNNINTVSSTVNVASIEDNVVNKNIVYGCTDDSKMPNLEEIVYSDDDEDVDTKDDMTNLDTHILVSPILTTRIHKDHPVEQIIRDTHSAPQTRRMTKSVTDHVEPKKVIQPLTDPSCIEAMQDELLQFKLQKGYAQEEGIDYDEAFAPVARIEAIRLFLAYASFKDFVVYQIDVKSAFLYGKIEEEVYVCQPPRFEDPEFPGRVYKVEKSLYGLHQAPRAWYDTLSTYLLDNGFQRGQIDKTLFIERVKSDILLVQVYVDDIIFGSTRKEMCTEFEKMMHQKF